MTLNTETLFALGFLSAALASPPIAFADAPVMTDITLRIDSHSEFTRCLAEVALSQVIIKNSPYEDQHFNWFVGTGVDGVGGPYPTATMDFVADNTDHTLSEVFTVRLRAIGSAGWKLLEDPSGEITPFAKSVDPKIDVLELDTPMGTADMSKCQ